MLETMTRLTKNVCLQCQTLCIRPTGQLVGRSRPSKRDGLPSESQVKGTLGVSTCTSHNLGTFSGIQSSRKSSTNAQTWNSKTNGLELDAYHDGEAFKVSLLKSKPQVIIFTNELFSKWLRSSKFVTLAWEANTSSSERILLQVFFKTWQLWKIAHRLNQEGGGSGSVAWLRAEHYIQSCTRFLRQVTTFVKSSPAIWRTMIPSYLSPSTRLSVIVHPQYLHNCRAPTTHHTSSDRRLPPLHCNAQDSSLRETRDFSSSVYFYF